VLTDPSLLAQLDGIATEPRAIAMTVLLSGFLTLSYLVVYSFMRFDSE
jgi:hypothetical protein